MGESLPEISNPVDSECEIFNNPPSENHEHIVVCDESLTKETSSSSESEDFISLYSNLFDGSHSHEQPYYPMLHSSH